MGDAGDALEGRLAGEWERVRQLQEQLRAAAQRAAERERQLDELARKLERKTERSPLLRGRRERAPAADVEAEKPPDPALDELRRELDTARRGLAEREAEQAELERRAEALDARESDLAAREQELERLRFALAAQREQLAALAERLQQGGRERGGELVRDPSQTGFADGLRAMARRATAQKPPAPN